MASSMAQKSFLGTSGRTLAPARGVMVAGRQRMVVEARATKSKASSSAMVCIDCGYIYDGDTDFSKLPGGYKCPVCDSGKKRFKAFEGKVNRKNDPKSMVARRTALREQIEASGEVVEADNGFLYATAAGTFALLGAFYAFTQLR